MSSNLIWEELIQRRQRNEVVHKDSNVEGPSEDEADKVQSRDMYQPDSSLLLHFQENTLREYMRSANVPNSTLQTSPLLSHVDIFTTCAEVLCSPEEPRPPGNADARRTLQKYAANYWMAHFRQIIDIATSKTDGVQEQTYTISAPDEVVTRVVQCFSSISSDRGNVVKASSNAYKVGTSHLTKLTASRNYYSIMQDPATMTSTTEYLTLSNYGHRRPLKAHQIC
jgi:hypothetical protein